MRQWSVVLSGVGKCGDETINGLAPALAHPSRQPLTDALIGHVLRQSDLEDHLRLLTEIFQRYRDDRAVIWALAVNLWPAIYCAPGEHELLSRHDLAIDAASDILEVLVNDHLHPPRAAHAQIRFDRFGW